VPQLLEGVLAQVKNNDEQFWKEKLHAANGKAQHALINHPIQGEVGNFLFVPIKFPNMFPKMLPITPYGLPIVQLPCI